METGRQPNSSDSADSKDAMAQSAPPRLCTQSSPEAHARKEHVNSTMLLNKSRDAWDGNRGFRWFGVPGVAFGREVFFRVHRLLPRDRLARVSRHAAHDGEQRAFGHVIAVVDHFAIADADEQFFVLGVGLVVLLARVAPFLAGVDLHSAPIEG